MICGVPEYLLYESLLYASRTSMFQSSWGTSAANVCVPWPEDTARMPNAQAWFEVAIGWVKKKKCKFGMST